MRFQRALQRLKKDDFCLLRLEALVKATTTELPEELRFDAVVVDEAQDLTLAQVDVLKALDCSPHHAGFMVVGDGQQSIFPGGFSLRSAGLDVRGRSFVLHTNWRNTQAIAEAAEAALGDVEVRDMEEQVKLRAAGETTLPQRPGDPPELWLIPDKDMADALTLVITDALVASSRPSEIGVLARTNKLWQRAESALRAAGVPTQRIRDLAKVTTSDEGVRVGTFEGAKGLEFKVVLLYACSRSHWAVIPRWLHDPEDLADWWQREVRKLFVAMTRPRDRLVILTNDPLPRPLQRAQDRCAIF